MSGTADNSLKNIEAMLKEARAVKKTTKAYNGLQRGSAPSTSSSASYEAVSKQIVLAYLGGGR